jgi:hypothetical protein
MILLNLNKLHGGYREIQKRLPEFWCDAYF